MDLNRILEKAKRNQWSVGDLDWSRKPRPMSREDEIAAVQYFTDMSQIERMAAALFFEQGRRQEDPLLKEIFLLFGDDEIRHAHATQMLADYYDVHHYKAYSINPHVRRFTPQLVRAIRYLSPHMAAAYVTAGELLLDTSLLRSINDFVDDPMSRDVIERINRDESLHVAVDYHMAEYYASDDYHASEHAHRHRSLMGRLRVGWIYLCVALAARPFIREGFFRPMDSLDPEGRRLREAFKRIQLFGAKAGIRRHRDAKILMGVQWVHNLPLIRPLLGRFLAGIIGMESRFLEPLHTESEADEFSKLSFDRMAQEALALKNQD